jgi:hypothetical protein
MGGMSDFYFIFVLKFLHLLKKNNLSDIPFFFCFSKTENN